MRLLEFVRCGRPAVADDFPSPSASPETPVKQHRKPRRSQGGADSTWQPSLGVISEEDGLLFPPAKSLPSPVKYLPSTAKSLPPLAKAGKNPEKGRGRRSATVRPGERDSYRHYDVSGVFPALAPTIFMF